MDHAQRPSEAPSRPAEVVGELIPQLRGVSHAVAFFVAIAAAVVVIVIRRPGAPRWRRRSTERRSIALFGGSALYHRCRDLRVSEPVLRGSITARSSCSSPPATRRSPCWSCTAAGVGDPRRRLGGRGGRVTFSLGWIHAPRGVIAGSYLALGWVAVITIPQLLDRLEPAPLILLGSGGLLYSIGALVYARRWPNPWPRTFGFHEIFHALVIAAASVHCVAVIGWVLPRA